MKQANEIDAVELVRRIRDAQAEQLAGRSAAEVMEYFNRAGERSRKRARKRPAASTTRATANSGSKRSVEKLRRR